MISFLQGKNGRVYARRLVDIPRVQYDTMYSLGLDATAGDYKVTDPQVKFACDFDGVNPKALKDVKFNLVSLDGSDLGLGDFAYYELGAGVIRLRSIDYSAERDLMQVVNSDNANIKLED